MRLHSLGTLLISSCVLPLHPELQTQRELLDKILEEVNLWDTKTVRQIARMDQPLCFIDHERVKQSNEAIQLYRRIAEGYAAILTIILAYQDSSIPEDEVQYSRKMIGSIIQTLYKLQLIEWDKPPPPLAPVPTPSAETLENF